MIPIRALAFSAVWIGSRGNYITRYEITLRANMFYFRKRVGLVPRALEAMPQAPAGHVGLGPGTARQVGDQSERDPADTETRPRELWRGLLRQVAQQDRGRGEDAATRYHVHRGLPPGKPAVHSPRG
jgi:hypothetical protein